MKLSILFLSAAFLAQGTRAGVFEETKPGIWRSAGGSSRLVVTRSGFAVEGPERRLYRFAWDEGLMLADPLPKQSLDAPVFRLSGDTHIPMKVAGKLCQGGRDVTLCYYFGPRGLEFDLISTVARRQVWFDLYSVDADVDLDSGGGLRMLDRPLMLQPAAYAESGGKNRFAVSLIRRIDKRHVRFQATSDGRAGRLVVDPVVTYPTYLGGSANEISVAVQDMGDGSMFVAGNTYSLDLPQGFSITGPSGLPANPELGPQCFIARFEPATKVIRYLSYLGFHCDQVQVDKSGRAVVLGATSSGIATTDAEQKHPVGQRNLFLARVAADGRSMEYGTYLPLNSYQSGVMALGPNDMVYVAASCDSYYEGCVFSFPVVLARHNMQLHRTDQQRKIIGADLAASIAVLSDGTVVAGGMTTESTLAIKNPLRNSSGRNSWVSGYSADLQSIVFSSYVGDDNRESVDFITPVAGGLYRISGEAGAASFPGLIPLSPFKDNLSISSFSVVAAPGHADYVQTFLAGGNPWTIRGAPAINSDGRSCISLQAEDGYHLACFNATGDGLTLDAAMPGGSIWAPSASGGVWSLSVSSPNSDAVPQSLKGAALEPYQPGSPSLGADLLVTHIDLRALDPVLVFPQQVRLQDLTFSSQGQALFEGRNFAQGMQLDIGGTRFPLTVLSSSVATLTYFSPDLAKQGPTLGLPSGNYDGHLVVPGADRTSTSPPFPIIIGSRPGIGFAPPPGTPFLYTSNAFQFSLDGQVIYTLTKVGSDWNLSAFAIGSNTALRTVRVAVDAAIGIVSFRISSGSRYLYLLTDRRMILRFQTSDLAEDLRFMLPDDAPPVSASSPIEKRTALVPLEGFPEGIVVSTPSGRLVIYDGGQGRSYSTAEFPQHTALALTPIFATASAIYAQSRIDTPNIYHGSSCLIRYPYDELGVAPAEEMCDLAQTWGEYPEMKTFPEQRVLAGNEFSAGIVSGQDGYKQDSPSAYDIAREMRIVSGCSAPFSCLVKGIPLNSATKAEIIFRSLGALPQPIVLAGDTLGFQVGSLTMVLPLPHDYASYP